jgi:predicted GIY-YIG superfamily endonuclease
MRAILYRLTFPSNKSYIGITTKTLERRCRGHRQGANGTNKTAIACAIRKYKNFKNRRKPVF